MQRDDSKVKQILFVTNDFGPRAGGIETFIIGLIERLPKNQVLVYTSKQGDTQAYDKHWQERYGVEVIRDRTKVLLPTPRVARAVSRLAKNRAISIVCFGAAAPLGLLAPSLRRAGVSRIISLTHGHEVWWAKVFPFSLALKRIGNKVDVLTYLGDFTKEAISICLTPSAKKAMVKIAPGIDVEHFNPDVDSSKLRNYLGLTNKSVIVSVGRLVHRKGQDRLIGALPAIRKAVPNVHLLIVGEGPYKEKLISLAKNCGVMDCITFVGRIQYSQLPEYVSAGDLFAMPSRSRFNGLEVEGLGIVYLEASACGLPVIAGNSGGAPDAVLEGTTGVVVDGNSISDISSAAISLLLNPALMKSMGKAGHAWISKEWTWQRWSAAFAKVLEI
ncbi:unannotated protein [freshwater metagenome]|uniref:Unannotated protein n=1 Tax=freshwater metagenome TaxID=449393 RepID=A0A6J7LPQ7_9ZZZZ